MLDKTALYKPAADGIRQVALALAATAEESGRKLKQSEESLRAGNSAGDDLLHDFRVATRRLRSWLRGFDSHLDSGVRKKNQRRLTKIVKRTNGARDAAVHSDWMRTHKAELAPENRAGYEKIEQRLDKQRVKGIVDEIRAVDKLERILPQLRDDLETSGKNDSSITPRFGNAVADVIEDEADALQERLGAIRGTGDFKRAHRARIAGKRLRYIIEPVSNLAANGNSLVESLKSLQDLFGGLQDISALEAQVKRARKKRKKSEDSDLRPGMKHLEESLCNQSDYIFSRISNEWLGQSGDEFFKATRVFADELARESEKSAAPESANPPAIASDAQNSTTQESAKPREQGTGRAQTKTSHA